MTSCSNTQTPTSITHIPQHYDRGVASYFIDPVVWIANTFFSGIKYMLVGSFELTKSLLYNSYCVVLSPIRLVSSDFYHRATFQEQAPGVNTPKISEKPPKQNSAALPTIANWPSLENLKTTENDKKESSSSAPSSKTNQTSKQKQDRKKPIKRSIHSPHEKMHKEYLSNAMHGVAFFSTAAGVCLILDWYNTDTASNDPAQSWCSSLFFQCINATVGCFTVALVARYNLLKQTH